MTAGRIPRVAARVVARRFAPGRPRVGTLLLAGVLITPWPLVAQDTVIVARPETVLVMPSRSGARGSPAEERAFRTFNAEGTMRLFGTQRIGRPVVIRSNVGAFEGTLTVDGAILGDLVAINADVILTSSADIRGSVLVVGGTLEEDPDARVDGSLERHSQHVPARRVGDRLEFEGQSRHVTVVQHRRLRRSPGEGRASLVLGTERTYNRVEGLPVFAGPRLTWRDPNVAVRLEGFAIWRTATGFDPDVDQRELGYRALADLRFGPERSIELGGTAYDVVSPIEDWQLSDEEVGIAALLWHRDYRDYFLKRGAAAFLRLHPSSGLTLFGEIARNEATSVAARDPWTPFRNSEPWRPNPLIDAGHFTQFTAGIDVDTREDNPWDTGVRLHAEWEHGVSHDLTPVDLPLAIRSPPSATDYRYDRLFGDLRLYQPLGFGSLTLRAAGGGVVGNGELPVQRRFSLGGPDPLPGYAFRRFACNEAAGDPAMPALCDRVVLFQAEYRGGLHLNPFDEDRWDHDARRHGRRDANADWGDVWWEWEGPQFVLFTDAGTAWLRGEEPGPLKWDVGAGLEFGSVGIYAARAIERDQPIRVFLRVQHRF